MNAPVTRRALLGATAAVGVLSMPTLVEAGIPESDLDAGLLALIARHGSLVEAQNAHRDVHDAADRRFREAMPERPDALWDIGDIGFHLCTEASGRAPRPSGRVGGFYQFSDVEKLRAGSPVTRWAIADDAVQPPPHEPDPKGEARRQKIIAASDAWEAEKAAVADRVGLTAAIAEDDRLYEAVWEARDAIRVLCPGTMVGLRAKSRWVMGLNDPEEEAAALVEQVAAFGGAAS